MPTAHGEIEYETVECVSCGEEVAKNNTSDVVIGEISEKREYSWGNKYRFESGETHGYACEYCKDDPVKFPRGRTFDIISSTKALVTALLLFLIVLTIF